VVNTVSKCKVSDEKLTEASGLLIKEVLLQKIETDINRKIATALTRRFILSKVN
jgi:hypothetical protein